MYAFIELKGHQHKVSKDMVLLSEKTEHIAGSEFVCSNVLLIEDTENNKTTVGTPTVSGAQVKLRVLDDIRAPKILGFKYKKRKGYRRKWGHRQDLQKLQVLAIETS